MDHKKDRIDFLMQEIEAWKDQLGAVIRAHSELNKELIEENKKLKEEIKEKENRR